MRTVKKYDLTDLVDLKNFRYDEIDKRTGELIAKGFVFAAKTFSLSKTAQLNLLGINASKDDTALIYPVKYNTIDDLDTHNLLNATDITNFYLTALGTKRAHLDSGTTLKDSIRTAIDIISVNEIIDNR